MKFIKSHWTIIFLFVISLTPLLWFIHHPNQLINGLDTNFPLNPVVWFQRRLFVWNDSLNGGLDMNSSVGGLFFHFLQYFPFILGFSLGVTQKITFIFWFGMTAIAAYYFSKTFLTKRKELTILFVLIYCFNIYLFNTWENVKVANLALVVGLPLALSLIELYRQRKISVLALLASQTIIAVISSGSGINPAYFIAMIAAIFLYFCTYVLNENKIQLVTGMFISGIGFLFGSLFWIVPLLDFLFFSAKVSTLESIGFTNWVASLSQNTSLVNVMRLLGAWDWYVKDNANVPIYIPYAIKYFTSVPFIFMSFVIPLLAFLGLTFSNQKIGVKRIFLLLLVIAGVFLGSGLHEPTGSLFSILLNKVPFFSFFRSPWYIFTPYTIIGFGGLAILFLESVQQKIPNKIYLLFFVILMGGYFLYSYPLWTGKVFRPNREDSFYVSTPKYVFDFATYLSNSSYKRVITYPDDQLEKFMWGYKGTDSFLGLLVDKEVYAPSFNYPNKNIESYLNRFYLRLKKGDTEAAVRMLPGIGVDSLLLKKDASTLSPDISDQFKNYPMKYFGPWTLVDSNKSTLISIPEHIYEGDLSADALSFVLPYFPENSIYITKGDSQLEKLPKSITPFRILQSDPVRSNKVQNYIFTVPNDDLYVLILEENIPADKLNTVLLDGKSITATKQYDDASKYVVQLKSGKHVLSTEFPLSIASVSPEFTKEINLSQATQLDQRITIPFAGFDPFVSYDLSFDYKYVYGNTPQIELVQSYSRAPLKVEQVKVAKNQDWLTTHFVFNPVALSSKLELILKIAENADTNISNAAVRNIQLNRIVSNRLFVYNETSSTESGKASIEKVNPTLYTAQITNVADGYFLLFKENYQLGWKVSSKDYIGGEPIHMQANGMYNLWFIPVGAENQTISISFDPQKKYQLSLNITVLSVVLSVLTLAILHKRKNDK